MTNHKAIQKHYHKLVPRERLALIIEAVARGDDAERETLIDSAPMLMYRMPDYHGEADAFNLVCLLYLTKQLDVAYLQATILHAEPKDQAKQERFYNAACISAYVICTRADAWRAFCEGLGIDADTALKGLPGADSLAMAENFARTIAYTAEEAQAAFVETAERLPFTGDLMTLESETQIMRATFERWAKIL